MDKRRGIEEELERERDKLHRMLEESRSTYGQTDEAIIEQSRKVDRLIGRIQKAGRVNKPDRERSR